MHRSPPFYLPDLSFKDSTLIVTFFGNNYSAFTGNLEGSNDHISLISSAQSIPFFFFQIRDSIFLGYGILQEYFHSYRTCLHLISSNYFRLWPKM